MSPCSEMLYIRHDSHGGRLSLTGTHLLAPTPSLKQNDWQKQVLLNRCAHYNAIIKIIQWFFWAQNFDFRCFAGFKINQDILFLTIYGASAVKYFPLFLNTPFLDVLTISELLWICTTKCVSLFACYLIIIDFRSSLVQIVDWNCCLNVV